MWALCKTKERERELAELSAGNLGSETDERDLDLPEIPTGSLSLYSSSPRFPLLKVRSPHLRKRFREGHPFEVARKPALSCSRHERVGLFCGAVIVPGPLLFPPPLPLSYAKSCATSLPAAFVPLFRLFFRHSSSQLCAPQPDRLSLSLSLSLSPFLDSPLRCVRSGSGSAPGSRGARTTATNVLRVLVSFNVEKKWFRFDRTVYGTARHRLLRPVSRREREREREARR